MTTQAKYGWAIGLIFAGIVGALPFRHHTPVSHDSKQVAKKDQTPEQDPNGIVKDGDAEDSQTEKARKPRLGNSQLLPKQPKSISNFDEIDQANRTQRNDFSHQPDQSMAQVVEQVPKRLDRNKLPDSGSINILENSNSDSDPSATQNRVGESSPQNQQELVNRNPNLNREPDNIKRNMPRGVGPYRMKPVPSASRFQPASQSGTGGSISRASRTRQVIQYKLRDGDSLRSIAKRYLGDETRYEEILSDNRHVLTNGEKFLPVGQYITIIVQ